MGNENVLDGISNNFEKITEQDLDNWVTALVFKNFKPFIKILALKSYGVLYSDVALRAFEQRSMAEIRKALYTFIFESKYWETNRNINNYIKTTLYRLSSSVIRDITGSKKLNGPICPACKFFNFKENCAIESKLYKCYNCIYEIENIKKILASNPSLEIKNKLETKLNLRTVFSIHSRKGYRCPDCEMFIPDSYIKQHGVSCPFPKCGFFGDISQLKLMNHPIGFSNVQQVYSLDFKYENNYKSIDKKSSLQDYLDTNEVDPEFQALAIEKSCLEYETLQSVINEQIARIKRTEKNSSSLKKRIMYQAYKNMLESNKEEMILYLVHMKHFGSSPIQAKIFQEYVRLIENSLPFTIGDKEIFSLQDPDLNLFLGVSKFDATIKYNNTINNNTVETYVGGRKMKDYGPCFIGMLIDIVNKNSGQSILSEIENYTFSQINMKPSVPTGTPVEVTHFRIYPHYEMGNLVNLQRIRKKLVDSTYFRLHGEKRKYGRQEI